YAPPAVTTINEGTPATVPLGSITDADAGDSWTVIVNWGDGTPNSTFSVTTAGAFTFPHTYDGPNSYPVTLTITDSIGASVGGGFTITILNVAPVLTPTGNAAVNEGSPYSLT